MKSHWFDRYCQNAYFGQGLAVHIPYLFQTHTCTTITNSTTLLWWNVPGLSKRKDLLKPKFLHNINAIIPSLGCHKCSLVLRLFVFTAWVRGYHKWGLDKPEYSQTDKLVKACRVSRLDHSLCTHSTWCGYYVQNIECGCLLQCECKCVWGGSSLPEIWTKLSGNNPRLPLSTPSYQPSLSLWYWYE